MADDREAKDLTEVACGQDWFLSDFTSCFTIAMGYLAFVFIGSVSLNFAHRSCWGDARSG